MENRSIADIWNSPQALEFRASILDGSFRYCREDQCPFMNQSVPNYWESNGAPFQPKENIKDKRLKHIIENQLTTLEDGPTALNCGYDRTCNLSCPTCRKRPISLKDEAIGPLIEFQSRIFSEVAEGLKVLYVTGSGDPFASAVYRHLLQNITAGDYPQMEVHLHTNALLWNRKNWEAMRTLQPSITTTHISIDAADEETYRINRKGGNWVTLMKNLKFISELRRNGPLRFVALSFVIQENNFLQMPAMIRMTERFGFDLAYFHMLSDWKSMSRKEMEKRAVHDVAHPRHHEFLRLLTNEIFDQSNVGLYCLYRYRRRAKRLRRFGSVAFWCIEKTGILFRMWRRISRWNRQQLRRIVLTMRSNLPIQDRVVQSD